MMHRATKQEEFSRAYLQAVAAVVGCTVSYPSQDNHSIDCILSARYQGKIYSDAKIDIQLKTHSIPLLQTDEHVSYALQKNNYDDLRQESLALRILILILLPENIEDWLSISNEQLLMRHSAYWFCLHGYPESNNTTSVTLRIPTANLFTVQALQKMIEKVADGERKL